MDPNALHNLSYGVYLISSVSECKYNGQVANSVFQITSEPVTIAISINRKNLTYEFINCSALFTVSVLSESTPLAFIGKFGFKSGRTGNKFDNVKYEVLPSGCPYVKEHALCYLACKVIGKLDCGTHMLFLGEMTDSAILKDGRPMTYEYYHLVKRGITPKTAPTYIKGEETK